MALILGTRTSHLAMIQAHAVKNTLIKRGCPHNITIFPLKTRGDADQNQLLEEWSGKGLFTHEIDQALCRQEIDLALHCLKDVSVKRPAELQTCAYIKRDDPRDCFISQQYDHPEKVPPQGLIGTASIRRRLFLKQTYPHLRFTILRGNIHTRLKKAHTMAGTLLAYAGLQRAQLTHHIRTVLPPESMMPAPGQGVLIIECHRQRQDIYELCHTLNDAPTAQAARAERACVRALGAHCHTPLGAYCTSDPATQKLVLQAHLAHLSGALLLKVQKTGHPDNPEHVGLQAAQTLLSHMPEGLDKWLASPVV